jgi:shikimate dehydrogenase
MTGIDIDGYTRLVGLLGEGVGPSPRPRIYNAAFEQAGLNWRCVPLPAPLRTLREAMLGLRALGFAGADVLAAFQSDVLAFLDEYSPAAEIIGAANVIWLDEQERLIGDNTRWLAFAAALHTLTPSLNGLRPLVIGAGQSAHSVVYALAREGLPVTVVDERIERALDLVQRLRHALDEHSFSVYRWPQDARRVLPEANLIVNTLGAMAWPAHMAFPPNALVFDVCASSDGARFSGGGRAVGALPLLVYEMMLTFEKWTGDAPPVDVMWRAVEGVWRGEGMDETVRTAVPAAVI